MKQLDPFAALGQLLAGVSRTPLPPLLLVTGDDDWIVGEAVRRLVAAFGSTFREGEVSQYPGPGANVRDAVDDAATIALFSTNRFVVLEGSDLFRAGRVSAEEVDELLDEAEDAGLGQDAKGREARVLERLARKAWALSLGAGFTGAAEDAARRLAGRVKRSARAEALSELMALTEPPAEAEGAAERLVDYAREARPADNALLVFAVTPDPEHGTFQAVRRAALWADFTASDDASRRARLAALGLERALDRNAAVEPDVFDTLLMRGRTEARPFLSELDRLIDSSPGSRVTAEAAARSVLDERKEYGTDFVEAVLARRMTEALGILRRLLTSQEFTAFRPFGKKEETRRKATRGEAAFFPLLGLLAGEIRRVTAVKAACQALGGEALRRTDYRSFTDRLLPALRAPRAGMAPMPADAHPFVLHKAHVASLQWSLPELVDALLALEAIDRGVKTGVGAGEDLLVDFLLARVTASG